MWSRADGPGAILAAAIDLDAGEDLSALGGDPLLAIAVEDVGQLREAAGGLRAGAPILVGVDESGDTPAGAADVFDILLTTAARPPRPWVAAGPLGIEGALSLLRNTTATCPTASAVFATVLRLGDQLDFEGALTLESLAYSTLLGGREFRAWRAANPPRSRKTDDAALVRLRRDGEVCVITLTRPAARNAIGARLRDELTQALRLVRLDPSLTRVELRGEGACFSAGGDLDEFGQAGDLALAHIIRTQRSPAWLADQVGHRLTVYIQGAAIGGGIEIAAAAASVTADPGAVFRLPEVGMGLIPGAGGTASLPRRIGRHRTCFMGLSGLDVDAEAARGWGLVDRLEPVA